MQRFSARLRFAGLECWLAVELVQGAGRMVGNRARSPRRASALGFLDEAVDDLLLAGLVEGNRQLVALDAHDAAVAELQVEDAVAGAVVAGGGAVGGGDEAAFAFDHLLTAEVD